MCINALTLTAISLGWITGNHSAWIYGSIAFTGIARAFIAPSYTTLFAIIVPRESYGRGAGIGSSIFQTGLVLGPPHWVAC